MSGTVTVTDSQTQCDPPPPLSLHRFEVLMQANLLSTEYDEISDMHKKVLKVSSDIIFCSWSKILNTLLFVHVASELGSHTVDVNQAVGKVTCFWDVLATALKE